MKKLIVLLALLIMSPLAATAATYYVNNTMGGHSDSNAGTSPASPFSTIQRCVAVMAAGDTCNVVTGGTYNERVTISGRNGTALNKYTFQKSGGGAKPKLRGFTIDSSSYITIDGFEMTNVGMSADNNRTIQTSNSNHIDILNNYIHETSNTCIRYGANPGSSFITIRGNVVNYCGETNNIVGTTTTLKVIVAGVSDQVKFKVQGGTSVTGTLTPGNRTAIQVCTDVNAAITAALGSLATARCDFGADDHVVFRAETGGPSSLIELEPVANNAYTALGMTTGVGVFIGTQAAIAGGNAGSSDILIDQNDLSNVGDYLVTGGSSGLGTDSRIVFRKNNIGPADVRSPHHIDGVQVSGTGTTSFLLIEQIKTVDNNNPDNHFFLSSNPTTFAIFRQNETIRSNGGMRWGSGSPAGDAFSFYNNTWYDNQSYYPNNGGLIENNDPGALARNNIWYRTGSTNADVYNFTATPVDNDYELRFLTGATDAVHQLNADPLFVNGAGGDYRLQAASPARNQGGPLTTVHATLDSGNNNTTTLVVNGAFPFQDGWAGVDDDWIAVGSVSNAVQIASINYTTNTITLASPISRAANDPVWLYKNSSGERVLFGTAPDLGAYPYDPGGTPTVTIETAANGTGSVVGSQNVAAGASVTGFAISRDAGGNFVSNVAATWSLTNVTGGVVSGNLVPAGDNKSAVFTGSLPGTARMTAVSGGLTGNSGTLTVTAGAVTTVTVETAANGSGTVIGAQNVAAGASVTGFAIQRDSGGNFVANAAAAWSVTSVTGGVVSGDLVPAGDNKSAVFTGHLIGSGRMTAVAGGLTGNSGTLTVTAGAAAAVTVETAANGSGTVVGAQNVASGASVTGFAIQRDSGGNFVSNAVAAWSLTSVTGGVVNGDLVPAGDNRSAVFTGHLAGTARMTAVAGGLTGNSGILTATAGAAATVTVETAANGSGTVVGAQNVAAGASVTGFAIQRDSGGNFVANAAAAWSVTSVTGGVVSGDLVPAGDNKSAVFTGHLIGSGRMTAVAGGLTGNSGTLTVTAGAAAAVTVETAANGSGTVVGAQNVASGASVTGFAIQRDSGGNFVSNAVAAWSLTSVTGGVVNGDLVPAGDNRSAVFTGHLIGTARMTAVAGGLTGNSGILTAIAGAAATVTVETAANGSGSVVGTQSVGANATVTGFSIQRDALGNFVSNVVAVWSLTSVTGGVVSGDLVPAGDNRSAVLTGHAAGTARMTATAGGLTGDSGVLTVVPFGISVETAADGSGAVVGAQNVASGASVTGFAIQRDGGGAFVSNVVAVWSLANVTGGVVNGDLVPAGDNKSAVFTGHLLGTARMAATNSSLTGTSGILTVTAGAAASVSVETAANGSGAVVGAQPVAANTSVTGFAVQRDALGNFVANAVAVWSLTNVTGGVVNGDLVPAGDNRSAVFTGHAIGTARMTAVAGGLTGNSGTLTVTIGAPTSVRVETAADGSGTIVPVQNVTAGASVTGFAIQRDALGNFVSNAVAVWSLTNVTGGVVNGDLVPAGDGKSAVFTGHLIGSGNITAVAGGLTGNSGALTVIAGPAAALSVETGPDGSGAAIGNQSLGANASLIGFAIQRDAGGNFVANVAATWSLTNLTGGVVNGDLVPAGDGKSAVFTGHLVGTARMTAVAGAMTASTGTLSVVPFVVSIETAADGSGAVLGAQNVVSGAAVTGFAIQRDGAGAFVSNVVAVWSLTSLTGGVTSGDLVPAANNKSAVFTGHLIGTAKITASDSGLTADSGTLTVTVGTAATVSVETAANGTGALVLSQSIAANGSITGFSIQRDASGNFRSNVAAVWSLTNVTGGVVSGDLVPAGDNKSAVFTGHLAGGARMTAVAGGLTGHSGTFTVTSSSAPPPPPPPPTPGLPVVSITAPANGATLSGVATVTADAAGIIAVQFLLDGTNLGAELTSPPFSVDWNTLASANGAHSLSAVARNSDGDRASAAAVGVIVSNLPAANNYTVSGVGAVSFVTTNQDIPPLTISHAVVNQNAGSAAQAGVAIIGYRPAGVLVSEAGIPASPQLLSGRTYVEVAGSVNTGIAMSNLAEQEALVSFYFTDATGRDFGFGILTLEPHRQITSFLNAVPFNAPLNFQGTFTFQSSVPIGVVAIRGLTNERNEFLMVPQPITQISAESGQALLPHFADGGGWTTQIVLTNSSQTTLSGTVQVFGQGSANQSAPLLTLTMNGVTASTFDYSIPAHATVRFVTAGTDPVIQVGSVRVAGAAPDSLIPAVSAIMSFRNNGITVSEAGLTASPASSALRIYVESSGISGQVGSIQTGIAISNPSPAPVAVNIQLYGMDGTQVGAAQNVILPASGQLSSFINDLFPQPGAFRGTARLTSTAPVALIVLRGRINERGDFLMAMMSPLDDTAAPAGTALVFPHIVSGTGFGTQLIMFGGAGSGGVSLYSQDGELRPSGFIVNQP